MWLVTIAAWLSQQAEEGGDAHVQGGIAIAHAPAVPQGGQTQHPFTLFPKPHLLGKGLLCPFTHKNTLFRSCLTQWGSLIKEGLQEIPTYYLQSHHYSSSLSALGKPLSSERQPVFHTAGRPAITARLVQWASGLAACEQHLESFENWLV